MLPREERTGNDVSENPGECAPGMVAQMIEQPVPVLIAAENPADRTGLEKILADSGYRKVVTVANGLDRKSVV
jgi:hypothetical protein